MTVNSWLLSLVRVGARFYVWILAIGVGVYLVMTSGQIIGGLFGNPPTSYVIDVGFDHPALAAGVRMVDGSPLAVGHDSPVVGNLIDHLRQVVAAGYPILIVVLALRVLDLARTDGPFADAMPRRLRLLGWALVAQPLSALAQGLCSAYLNSHLLADTSFDAALSLALGRALSWAAVLAGVGILVFRSVIVEGVGMRHDLDGTV